MCNDKGLLGDIRVGSDVCTVAVRPAFYSLSFDQKKAAAMVLYGDAFTGQESSPVVVFRDWQTNKKVGTFSAGLGLLWNE